MAVLATLLEPSASLKTLACAGCNSTWHNLSCELPLYNDDVDVQARCPAVSWG